MNEIFEKNGIFLKETFINEMNVLFNTVNDIGNIDNESFIFSKFIEYDLRKICNGFKIKITNFSLLNNCIFEGTIIVQVENHFDIANCSHKTSLRTKRQVLKLKLTDGKNELFGFECSKDPFYFKIGLRKHEKLLISGRVIIRRGLLFLNNTNCKKLNSNLIITTNDIKSIEPETKEDCDDSVVDLT